ncbi:MAG: hypothetical protein JWQ38_1935 [Flavipsychrobacter sp.]|nr:hypothetical protein [Flavipsychrobacter sp.]
MLVSAALCMNAALAQHAKPALHSLTHTHMLSALLGQGSATASAAKTTGGVPMSRVIAQSTWDNTLFSLSDSVKLGYSSGSHYSIYDYNSMLYPYNYQYNATPVFNNGEGIFGKPQALYDTFNRWTINPNTLTYGFYETAYATYNANTCLTSYLDLFADSVFNPNMRYDNKFNAAKNIDTGYAYIWKGGVAKNTFRQFYTYNTAGKLTGDTTYELHLGVWRMAAKTAYTYNTSNDLTQIDNYANTTDTSFLLPLVEKYKYTNTYDASHRLLTIASSFYDGTTLAPYIIDTFAYTGTAPYHSTWKEHQWDPINGYWAPMFFMHKVINTTTSLPDTVFIDGFDSLLNSWIPQSKYVMTYNTDKNPIKLFDYEYDFTAFPATPDFITTYYYGAYTNTAGTNNIVKTADNLKIFPNPASGDITISGLDVSVNAPVVISLMNVSGQVVSRTGMQWQNEAHVSMRELTPGVYWVVVHDGDGNIYGRRSVVRQ